MSRIQRSTSRPRTRSRTFAMLAASCVAMPAAPILIAASLCIAACGARGPLDDDARSMPARRPTLPRSTRSMRRPRYPTLPPSMLRRRAGQSSAAERASSASARRASSRACRTRHAGRRSSASSPTACPAARPTRRASSSAPSGDAKGALEDLHDLPVRDRHVRRRLRLCPLGSARRARWWRWRWRWRWRWWWWWWWWQAPAPAEARGHPDQAGVRHRDLAALTRALPPDSVLP